MSELTTPAGILAEMRVFLSQRVYGTCGMVHAPLKRLNDYISRLEAALGLQRNCDKVGESK